VPHTNAQTCNQTGNQTRTASRPTRPSRRSESRIDIGTFESNLPEAGPPAAQPPRPPADRLVRVRRPDPADPGITGLAICQAVLRAPDAARLRSEIVANHTPGRPLRVVLCCRGLTSIAAPCLATLAELAEALTPTGGSLVLVEVPPPIARVLKRTGLSRTLRVAKSNDRARKLVSVRKPSTQAA
jgi:anti-anti-sigma factor